MASLLLRLNKAAPLTLAETDDNLLYLEGLITGLTNSKLSTSSLLTQLKIIDGSGTGLDADMLDGMQPSDQAQNNTIVSRNASGDFSAHIITATQFIGNASTATSAGGFTGIIPFVNGGTGVASITMGYVKSNGTTLTSVSTISGSDVTGDISGYSANVNGIVAIVNGGTGASDIYGARIILGLIPGQTIQEYSANLQSLSGISSDGIISRGNGIFATRSIEVGSCLQITNPTAVSGNPRIEVMVIDIAHGGTGSNTASSALANLGGAPSYSAALGGIPTAATAQHGTNTTQLATTAFVIGNSSPAGTILTLAHLTPPIGFLLNDGGSYLSADYPDLFAIIGTRFGVGNGQNTFRVPILTATTGFISVIKT